jgi:hypothetical protein
MEISKSCCICSETYTDAPTEVIIVKHTNDRNLDDSRKRGHYFHRDCLEKWKQKQYESGMSPSCPLDRDPIAKIYTVPGYLVVGFELGLYGYDYQKVITDLKINDLLLDQIAVNDIDKNHKTLAFYACKIGNYALINRLLKKRADFNQQCGQNKFTPLMVAVCHNHHRIVSKLLSNKKVVDGLTTYDNAGTTAFGYSCQHFHYSIICEFLTRQLVSKHQVRYYLELYRNKYIHDTLYGDELISKMCHYLKL